MTSATEPRQAPPAPPARPAPGVRARVWAPTAGRVDLVDRTAGSSTAMTPDPAAPGWWRGPDLARGTDYWFSPDGAGPFPDPRSRWQPRGVDGPSRAWAPPPPDDPSWVASPQRGVPGSVVYEVHVGTFTPGGTLRSAIGRLDDLVDLGVDTVELMPLAQFSGEFGWGYDGVDLFAVHDPYGGPDAMVDFVNAAHTRGLSVCVDTVLNHLGAWGNHLSSFGPYYSERHQTPWGPGFDLDGPDSQEPRNFLVDVCRNWLVDMHVDALRLDAVHAIQDDSPRHLLEELSDEVGRWGARTGRVLTLVAESDLNQPRTVEPRRLGGVGMDAQWADDVHHALFVALTGERQGYYADFAEPGALVKTLEDVFLDDGRWSEFRSSVWGAPVPPDMDRRRFVVYSQDHDQVGNRARGDRPSESLGDAQLAGVAALVVLGAYTPMLFQGEEWGTRTPFSFFSDQETPERAKLVREGRVHEFDQHGWAGDVPDPTARGTMEACVLDWSEREGPRGARMLAWYRELLGLRRASAGARAGRRQRASRRGDVVRLVNGELAVEVDLRGRALPGHPALPSGAGVPGGGPGAPGGASAAFGWPTGLAGRPGRLLAAFPAQDPRAGVPGPGADEPVRLPPDTRPGPRGPAVRVLEWEVDA